MLKKKLDKNLDYKKKNKIADTGSESRFHPISHTEYVMNKEKTYFTVMGGSSQVGMNLNLFCHNDEIIIVDVGIAFLKKNGIDVIMPSLRYLDNKKVTAIFITHGHDDHIAAVQHLCKKMNVPIFATAFCEEVLKNKLDDPRQLNVIRDWDYVSEIPLKKGKFNLVIIEPKKNIKAGSFEVEFIRAAHSIVESHMLYIRNQYVNILHTGDWKIDKDAPEEARTDEKRLREIGSSVKIDIINCDSTNSCSENRSPSEMEISNNILDCIKKFPKNRVFVCLFSSNSDRMNSFLRAARSTGRPIYALGRAISQMINATQNSGYMEHHSIKVLPDFKKIPNDNSIILCTGSQAEPRSALYKIAYAAKPIIKPGDIVIFSSRTLSHNDVRQMQGKLVDQGAIILDGKAHNLHTTGHASVPDIKDLISWIKPACFIPVHGDPVLMSANEEIAKSMSVPFVSVRNGSIVEINKEKTRVVGVAYNAILGLDGTRLVNIESKHLLDRERLGTDGMICVSVDHKNNVVLVLLIGLLDMKTKYAQSFQDSLQKEIQKRLFGKAEIKENSLTSEIAKQTVKEKIFRELGKSPLISVSINR